MNNFLYVICGPTCSGKTELAINLARKIGGEIVSADSMQIYKGFDIGTAKPNSEELKLCPHHLIDVADGNDSFSVADYKELATKSINDIINRGKTPVICGGTGFYINSILFDLSYGNAPSDSKIREKYENYLNENGIDALYNVLLSCDKESAEKINKNDVKRVIRAIEIFEVSGKKKSEIKDEYKKNYDYLAFSYKEDRKILYDRINRRVDKMYNFGLIDEVKNLLSIGILPTSQSMQAIGYKETYEYLSGNITKEEMIEKVKQNTRRYAKRQETFFKRLDGLIYLEKSNDINDTVEKICSIKKN